jgi:hypothetical protein
MSVEVCTDFGTGLAEIGSVLALICPVASLRILPALESPLELAYPLPCPPAAILARPPVSRLRASVEVDTSRLL